jgi:hypothetical protein
MITAGVKKFAASKKVQFDFFNNTLLILKKIKKNEINSRG